MDIVLLLFVFLIGVCAGAYGVLAFKKKAAPVVAPEPLTFRGLVSPADSPRDLFSADADYVRFTFKDGRVRVKKFPILDITPVLYFNGRRFKRQDWTPDGYIFKEVG